MKVPSRYRPPTQLQETDSIDTAVRARSCESIYRIMQIHIHCEISLVLLEVYVVYDHYSTSYLY